MSEMVAYAELNGSLYALVRVSRLPDTEAAGIPQQWTLLPSGEIKVWPQASEGVRVFTEEVAYNPPPLSGWTP